MHFRPDPNWPGGRLISKLLYTLTVYVVLIISLFCIFKFASHYMFLVL